jgi:hypothetical protein
MLTPFFGQISLYEGGGERQSKRERLNLNGNQIGDTGLQAFAIVCVAEAGRLKSSEVNFESKNAQASIHSAASGRRSIRSEFEVCLKMAAPSKASHPHRRMGILLLEAHLA